MNQLFVDSFFLIPFKIKKKWESGRKKEILVGNRATKWLKMSLGLPREKHSK